MDFSNDITEVVINHDGSFSLKISGLERNIPCEKIGSWIDFINTQIKLLELKRRSDVDHNYVNETLKERKKRCQDKNEWEFIKLHPLRPNFDDIKCLNNIIADCPLVDNISTCKGVYRLKGTEIILCDNCQQNNWDINDIKMEIENTWKNFDIDNYNSGDDSDSDSDSDNDNDNNLDYDE